MNFWLPFELVVIVAVLSGIIGIITFIATITEYRHGDYIGFAIATGVLIPICVAGTIWTNFSANEMYKIAEENYYKPVKVDFGEQGTIQMIYTKRGPFNANRLVGRIISDGDMIKHTVYEDIYCHIKYGTKRERWDVVKEK